MEAATKRLTVTGRVRSVAEQNLAVLLVANDGTSVRAAVNADGTFKVAVPARLVAKVMTRKRGKGPTLHVLRNGEYAGPVLLGKKGSVGYTRLIATANGTVSVGTLALKGAYATSTVKAGLVDRAKTIRLRSGAPVSSKGLRGSAVLGPVRSFASVVTETTVPGADSDRDGLPNFADADLNGDAVLDAAQPDPSVKIDGSSGTVKTVSRPDSGFAFQKQLTHPADVEVNSNANPSVTTQQIFDYLTKSMSVSMSVLQSAEEIAGTSVLVDCRKLSYCSPGSRSMLRAAPGSGIDGKELAVLQNADGLIVMPRRDGENTRMLRFYPGAASASEAALAGDTFELVIQRAGQTVQSKAYVVTSSFVTPMSVTSFNGTPVRVLEHQDVGLVLGADRRISLTFYRPQSFRTGSTSELLDRGGMNYEIGLFPEDGSNLGHVCPADSFSGLSRTLVKKPAEPYPGLFDTEQVPASNGTLLGVTVDVTKCKATGSGAAPVLVGGAKWKVYVMARDSDDNTADIGIVFTVG